MKRIILAVIFGFFLSANLVRADENFQTSLTTSYDVGSNGQTRITHRFKITNRTPLYFIKQYGIKVNSNQIEDVITKDNGQEIPHTLNSLANETSIGVTFPDEMVGEGKSRELLISYLDLSASQINGQVLEVFVPRLSNYQDYQSYSLEIYTPIKFGYPVRVMPAAHQTNFENGKVVTRFKSLKDESVVLIFGDEQIFQLKASYFLKNDANGQRLTQIALPPDTAHQEMLYQKLEPKPREMNRDDDGNWIATYLLPANSQTTVILEAKAKITLSPRSDFSFVAKPELNTQSTQYWPSQESKIIDIAKNLSDPKSIHNYTVKTLQYDYTKVDDRVDRQGALAVLDNPSTALCQEFTDLFITLARANNIPARRLTGFAYTENETLRPLGLVQDVLHAWPEYYDYTNNQWVSVDPTWEHTSGGINYFDQFDLNHLTFAINGNSDFLPYPAGSYKPEGDQGKTVEVNFVDSFEKTNPQVDFAIINPHFFPPQWPLVPTLELKNQSGQAVYDLEVIIQPSTYDTQSLRVDYLLPFQTRHEKISLINQTWFAVQKVNATVVVNNNEQNVQIILPPKILYQEYFLTTLAVVGITCTAITLITWSLLVFGSSKRSAVRRKS